MFESNLLDSGLFTWVMLPLLIFLARIVDVSISTVRIVFLSRGHKAIAPLLGFFEVIIWLLAISTIIRNLSNVLCYIAYGGGFAMGTYVGLRIEEKLAVGSMLVRVITRTDASSLVDSLKAADYGVTVIPAEGATGKVSVIYTVIRRRCLADVVRLIEQFNPRAFYTVENVRAVQEGVFTSDAGMLAGMHPLKRLRKGK